MSNLGKWLQAELLRRELTQGQVAVYSGVSQATISDIIKKEHIPRVDTLFRLADYFNVSRAFILRLAGHIDELEGFSGVKPEIKEVVYQLLETWDRIAELDETGDALQELLTVVTTQADAFLAAMRAVERRTYNERRESEQTESGE